MEVETVFINPIDADEAAPFIMAQLLHFGEPTELFSRAAVSRLTERAGGIPQMLSTLARSALHLAHTEQADTVRPRHVDEAAIRDGELSATNLQQRASPVGPASTTAPRKSASSGGSGRRSAWSVSVRLSGSWRSSCISTAG